MVLSAALLTACSSPSSAEPQPATRSQPTASPGAPPSGAGHAHGGHDHAAAGPAAHEDHTPRHGGQLGMQGDVHVELVARPDGRHRVFLSDAVRVPIATDRVRTGSLRFLPSAGGTEVESPLVPDPTTGALVATRPLPVSGGDVSVRVEVGSERVTMDFALPASPDPHAGHTHAH